MQEEKQNEQKNELQVGHPITKKRDFERVTMLRQGSSDSTMESRKLVTEHFYHKTTNHNTKMDSNPSPQSFCLTKSQLKLRSKKVLWWNMTRVHGV